MTISARAPEDSHHIEIADAEGFRWWCGKLGCSDLRLLSAVRQVGHDAQRVAQYLKMEKLFGRPPSAEELQDELSQRAGEEANAMAAAPTGAAAPAASAPPA